MEYTKEYMLKHIANLEKQLESYKRQIVTLETRLKYAYSKVQDDSIHEDQLELDCE